MVATLERASMSKKDQRMVDHALLLAEVAYAQNRPLYIKITPGLIQEAREGVPQELSRKLLRDEQVVEAYLLLSIPSIS